MSGRKRKAEPENRRQHWKKGMIERNRRMQAIEIVNQYIELSLRKLTELNSDNGQGKMLKQFFIKHLLSDLHHMKENC